MPLAGERLTASVLSVGIAVGNTPASTASNGTPTSGTTETFDTVLGYYQATLILGHRYEVHVNGLVGNGSVVADLYSIQVRDSQSSSNPTASSALIGQTQWYCSATGSGGRTGIELEQSFLCTVSGVHTFGISATRLSGTGIYTPISATSREIFVVDLGGN